MYIVNQVDVCDIRRGCSMGVCHPLGRLCHPHDNGDPWRVLGSLRGNDKDVRGNDKEARE